MRLHHDCGLRHYGLIRETDLHKPPWEPNVDRGVMACPACLAALNRLNGLTNCRSNTPTSALLEAEISGGGFLVMMLLNHT